MACILPASRKSVFKAALFAFAAMVFFDIITMKLGPWTLVTSVTYAALALFFAFCFKRLKKVHFRHFIGLSAVGVILFDIITGPIMSTLMFNQPLWFSIIGQIPFTLFHLVSAVSYTFFLVPVLDPDIREELAKSKAFSTLLNLNFNRLKWF